MVFSTLQSLHSSLVQISSSAPCSQTTSVYVPPLVSETRFRTHKEPQAKFIIIIIIIIITIITIIIIIMFELFPYT
jgi:cbb3-type cytochrome oxidase subunit 1